MRVYVIRHGESESNLNKKYSGQFDAKLTEKGKEDAKKAREILKGVSFDKIYASDLSRAMDTARIAIPDCVFDSSPLLREVDMGSLTDKPHSFLTKEHKERTRTFGYKEFGGESKDEFYERIRRVMKDLEGKEFETVALFCHAGFLRGMLDVVLDTRLKRSRVCCNNCTVAVFEFEDDVWALHSWINPA